MKSTKVIFLNLLFTLVGCTGQLPGSFRLAQQEETFASTNDVDTKIDLLWVVDNSASMDVAQDRLRQGFTAFANKYMKPTWDIRVAVITTDTYLANPAFNSYLNKVVPSTTGWTSPYIQGRLGTFVNPSWNPTLVNLSSGAFTNGIKYKELVPNWGPNYAKLLDKDPTTNKGNHDGPIAGLCSELLSYFYYSEQNCPIRDASSANTGVSHCLNPSGAETSVTQCVNTVENDSIHSGKAIINTLNADPVQLAKDFMINVTTGTNGQGSERGLGSVLQLLSDNEASSSATKFFRPGSLRGIIFVSDEEDQTMNLPGSPAASFNPQSNYSCDQAGLIALNPSANVSGNNGICCSNGTCSYGATGTTCPSKVVDGITITPSICPASAQLTSVSTIKQSIDNFFVSLDQGSAAANYFVVSIVPLTAQTILNLQAARDLDDAKVPGNYKTISTDRGDRYIQLGNLVGNGSFSMDIGASDFTPILNAIGNQLVQKKSTFILKRAPTGEEDMVVKVVHKDGSISVVPGSKYVVNDKVLQITDVDFVLSLAAGDQIKINYQPKTVY